MEFTMSHNVDNPDIADSVCSLFKYETQNVTNLTRLGHLPVHGQPKFTSL